MSELTSTRPKILIADDTPTNIKVLAAALQKDCQIIVATDGKQALDHAFNAVPDLILLDIMMPELDGYQVLQALKKDARTWNIPVIIITAISDEKEEAKGLEMGAVDFVVKPINPSIVRSRVRTHLTLKQHQDHLSHLVQERTHQINKSHLDLVSRLAQAGELRDNETGLHVTRMSHACALLGRLSGMDHETSQMLHFASSMHDIGKIGIPDGILLKPGKLNDDEWEVMKTHVAIGGAMLEGHDASLLQMAWRIAMTHHERWDGTGYPKGLKGAEIPLEGRITAICDVFDALTSERPYKHAWSVDEALAEMKKGSGSHFDANLLHLFMENVSSFSKISERFSDAQENKEALR
ncbi:MAG: response regulator [Mariprofundaceae bacterium]